MELERTIYFKNLFYRMFKGWRFVIIVIAISILLAIGYSWININKSSSVQEVTEETIESLREKLTVEENALVDLKISFAEKYIEQQKNVENYLEESYVFKNVMKQVPIYKYRYYVDNEITNICTYKFLIERRKVNVSQFNFYVDKSYATSLNNFTRDDRQDVAISIVNALKDTNIAKDLVSLAQINTINEEYSLYYDVSNGNEGFVTVSLIDTDLSDEVKNQIAERILQKINSEFPRLKSIYGDFDVLYDGCSDYIKMDPIVTNLNSINSNIVSNLQKDEVISEISDIVGLIDKEKLSKYITASSADNYICIRINNADIDNEVDKKLRDYLQNKILEIAANCSKILGQCDVSFVEMINSKDTDPLQNEIYNVINSMIYSFNESDFRQIVADILDVNIQYVNEYLSVSSEGNYFQYTITYFNLDNDKIEKVQKAIDDRLDNIYNDISNKLGKYHVTYLGMYESSQFNSTGASTRNSQIDSINSLINARNKLKDGLNSTQQKLYDLLAGKEIKDNNTSEDEAEGYNYIKIVVTNVIIAIVLGIILGWIVIVLKYIFSNKLQCAEDITNNEIKVWGIINTKTGNKNNKIDKFIDKLFYPSIFKSENEVEINLLVAKLKNYLENNDINKLLLMCSDNSLSEQACMNIFENIASEKIEFINNSLASPEVVSQLYSCDDVILVEKVLATTRININKELELCALCNKNILGAIVLV